MKDVGVSNLTARLAGCARPIRRLAPALLLFAACEIHASQATPAAVVSGLWQALTRDPGAGADVEELARLFHEDAVVFGATYRSGSASLSRTSAADFVKSQAGASNEGFHECEVARTLKVYDRFAVAYSVVESRTVKSSAAPDFVGVNSIQLYKDGDRWRILSLHYQLAPHVPVPLDGGTSGVCIQ